MIVVIDYEAGNLHNVARALDHLGYGCRFSSQPEEIAGASRIILPGVGSARTAMSSLEKEGLVEVIRDARVPLLGICLGMQLLFEQSEEDQVDCLGIVSGTVQRFDTDRGKVPHMGWNQVRSHPGCSLFAGIPEDSFFYFVHSYYAPVTSSTTRGVTNYTETFGSVVSKRNFWGVQFHPELSGQVGLRLLGNFLQWEVS